MERLTKSSQEATTLDDADVCDICGECADDEMGQFWDSDGDVAGWIVYAHAQCGIDEGLSLA